MISSFLVFFIFEQPRIKLPAILVIVFIALFALFITSYLGTMLEGPGYLPFYYPKRPMKNKDYFSGLVTTMEQENYIKENEKNYPKRTHFFHSSRRIVLRPDHFCDWVATFVGKKNYKLFYLFNFYGFLYIGFFFFTTFLSVKWNVNNKIDYTQFIFIIYLMLAAFFFLFTMMFCCGSASEISTNVTDWERLSNAKVTWDTSSCVSNWEEVFGSVKKWYLWLIPIGAFHGIDEYDLVDGNDAMAYI